MSLNKNKVCQLQVNWEVKLLHLGADFLEQSCCIPGLSLHYQHCSLRHPCYCSEYFVLWGIQCLKGSATSHKKNRSSRSKSVTSKALVIHLFSMPMADSQNIFLDFGPATGKAFDPDYIIFYCTVQCMFHVLFQLYGRDVFKDCNGQHLPLQKSSMLKLWERERNLQALLPVLVNRWWNASIIVVIAIFLKDGILIKWRQSDEILLELRLKFKLQNSFIDFNKAALKMIGSKSLSNEQF